MKKTYISPSAIATEFGAEEQILAGSIVFQENANPVNDVLVREDLVEFPWEDQTLDF